MLAFAFLGALVRELRRGPVTLAPDALAALRAYRWPGNVRELRNVLERGVVISLMTLRRRLREYGVLTVLDDGTDVERQAS